MGDGVGFIVLGPLPESSLGSIEGALDPHRPHDRGQLERTSSISRSVRRGCHMLQSVSQYNLQPYFVLIGDTYSSSSTHSIGLADGTLPSQGSLQLNGHLSLASSICAAVKRIFHWSQLIVDSL